jgi:hypothetical protein
MTTFFRVLDVDVAEKADALRAAVRGSSGDSNRQFDVDPTEFAHVPRSPFSYWVSSTVRGLFRTKPRLEGTLALARGGAKTYDDFRFVRLMWEAPVVSNNDDGWTPLNKGGGPGKFYFRFYLCINWRRDAAELRAFYEVHTADKGWGGFGRNEDCYYRPGVSWPLRTDGLNFRFMPKGFVFSNKGPALFDDSNDESQLLAASAVANSLPFRALVALQLARTELAQSYEVGLIQQTPVPALSDSDVAALGRFARRGWSLRRSLDTGNETSRAFLLPPGLNERITRLDRGTVETELESLQRQIDDAVFGLYAIGPADRETIEASSTRVAPTQVEAAAEGDDDDDSSEDEAPVSASPDALASWLVGVSFGRFDPRLATGERAVPPEPEPFDALPSRSPGMYPEGEEPGQRRDILVDDEGHADDLTARVHTIADHVRVGVPETLRTWLAKEFFPLHIKMYSKSRRKAPIYWQLATPSAGYSVWLYLHAFSKDTLFRVQNDYVAPKLAHEERRLESLTSELRDRATAAQRKQLAAQEALVDELRAFLDEVKRVAPLWKPNLDDGVIINFAPLWRLVPQNKAWQKELRATWDALCEGKYDWAHLAMHLCPERVVPKCAKDRSLAIAHGLEDVFWVEGTDGKWTARKAPTRSVDELVRERSSPAVKSALKSLLDAPVASGAAKKTKKGKAHA